MTSVVLVRTCFVSACANTLFNKRDSNPLNLHKAAVVARRTTRSNPPLSTHRLHRRSLATAARPGRRRRVPWSAYHLGSLRTPSHSFIVVRKLGTRQTGVARSALDQANDMDEMVLLQRSMDESIRNGASTPEEKRHTGRVESRDETRPRRFPDDPLTSPPHMDDFIETRSARSASTTSRSTNRLSLTLPILPPNAYSARPAPASTTAATFPPTPLDTPSLTSPVDSNDFITAIAAQERRVLELKEELSRAESDLVRLKKQWATHEAYKKRGGRRNVEPIPGLGPVDMHDETAIRRSVELDRRKALLGQQNQQATPERSRRRVFTGSHTRTLSLLSPTKPTGPFSDETDNAKAEPDSRFVRTTPALPKRATWAARTTQTAGVKQLAEDLKTGLWTFMEDLRQATVGDEPITGQGMYMRGRDGNMRPTPTGNLIDINDDGDTIRASSNPRPRVTSAFDDTAKASKQASKEAAADMERDDSDSAAPRPGLRRSKTDAGARPTKRFSWTPLTIDAYDDNDWSNWDSPSSSSPRWSGTTVNGDIIPTIPEKRADNEGGDDGTPLKLKPSKTRLTTRSPSPPAALSRTPSSPNKLEDILPQALNKLSPSNFKRTAADFMKEWERSLAPPAELGPAATAMGAGPVAVGGVGGGVRVRKEKGV